jgi:hypothetical protein
VDVEPIICADPLKHLHNHLRHTGEFDFQKSSSLEAKEAGMGRKVINRLAKQKGIFTSQPAAHQNGDSVLPG